MTIYAKSFSSSIRFLWKKMRTRTLSTQPSSSVLEERYAELLRESDLHGELASTSRGKVHHSVLVVHPKIRWGKESPSTLTDPQRQLEEAVALVNTLPNMRTTASVILGTDYNTKKKTIWGTGRIESLRELKEQHRVSAIMVNVDQLAPMQQSALHELFHVPIFDRYNIVLQIFKEYARTQETYLQIQLAEIPYIKKRLHYLVGSRYSADVVHCEPVTDKASGDKFEVLRLREQSLRKKLKELTDEGEAHTEQLHNGALVAVVGYTNAGKTSLVKRLTGAPTLKPLDRLFATLDTTRHVARLPSGRKVIFSDTIGFLSDLPVHLFAAFHSTLRHVNKASVILHLRDVSNPDWRVQSEHVLETLHNLNVDESSTRVITVDNKVDKLPAKHVSDVADAMAVSCMTGEGLQKLIEMVDTKVLEVSGCRPRRLALKYDSPAISYLYNQGLVVTEPEITDKHLIFSVFMTDGEFERFKKHSGTLTKKTYVN